MLNRKMSSWKWLYHCRVHCMRACCLHQRRWGDPTRHLQSCQTASASTLLAQTATWLQTQNPNRRRRGWRREGRELLENRLAKKKKRKKKKNTKKKMEKKWNNEERDNEERWKWLERWNLGDLNEWFENEMEGKKKNERIMKSWMKWFQKNYDDHNGWWSNCEWDDSRACDYLCDLNESEGEEEHEGFGSFWEFAKKAKREQVLFRSSSCSDNHLLLQIHFFFLNSIHFESP